MREEDRRADEKMSIRRALAHEQQHEIFGFHFGKKANKQTPDFPTEIACLEKMCHSKPLLTSKQI